MHATNCDPTGSQNQRHPGWVRTLAESQAGYNPRDLSVAAVHEFLVRLVDSVGVIEQTVTVGLHEALGRVLACDVISRINVPPSNNSAMDGYAFHGAALAGHELKLQKLGNAWAGQPWLGECPAGACIQVTTGAAMPSGLDTVIPQELCQVVGDEVCVPAGAIKQGENCRLRGEDIAIGCVALAQGTRLGPAELGLLASLNQAEVRVIRRVRVAYFSTGDEVQSVGEPAREGAIYDSNRFTVHALLQNLGCEIVDGGLVKDDPEALRHAFAQAAASSDVILTSGGVSVGEADHTKAVMRELGDVVFWRVAMRPGRPMAVGILHRGTTGAENLCFENKTARCRQETNIDSYVIDSIRQDPMAPDEVPPSCLLFGLPGNPVAVMVTFLAFVRPALLRLMGSREPSLPLLHAKSQEIIRKKPGRTEYQRGVVSLAENGQLQVRTTGQQGSGVLSSMVQANGLIVLPHESSSVAVGDLVQVMMFDGVLN